MAAPASPITTGAPNQTRAGGGRGQERGASPGNGNSHQETANHTCLESIGAHKPKPVNTAATAVPSTAAAHTADAPKIAGGADRGEHGKPSLPGSLLVMSRG